MIRIFNHYLSLRLVVLTAIEALVLFQSVVLGFHLRMLVDSAPLPLTEAVIFTAVMLGMMTSLGLYQSQVEPFRNTLQRLFIAYGLALLVMSLIFYLVPAVYIGRGSFAIASALALLGVLVVRLLFFGVTDLGLPKRRVLVLGNGTEAEQIIRFLHEGVRGRTIQYAGLYPVMSERESDERDRSVNHAQLKRAVRELRVSEIVIAVRERRGGVLPLRQLLDCKLRGVRVMDLSLIHI